MKKTRDIHHFWLFPKRPEFINFLSIFFLQGKRGKWITNYQKMMKNDKKLIKKWKKLETLIIFSFFEPSQGGVWGWGEVCQAGDVCQGSVRGGLCQGRSAGEICQGRSAKECQGRSARGELPGRYGRPGEARGGLPGEVCQGKLGRLAGEVCQVCNNMINWQLINQINKL